MLLHKNKIRAIIFEFVHKLELFLFIIFFVFMY